MGITLADRRSREHPLILSQSLPEETKMPSKPSYLMIKDSKEVLCQSHMKVRTHTTDIKTNQYHKVAIPVMAANNDRLMFYLLCVSVEAAVAGGKQTLYS